MAEGNYSFSYKDLFDAYDECLKNKRNTANAINFQMDSIESVTKLCDEINDGTYEIGKSITFVVKFPVLREVFAADFRDRIVHHLIIRELLPYFKEYFIDDSFACMEGKGVIYGVRKVAGYIKECTENYTKNAWILKMDIKSFFMSIEKQMLNDMLMQFIDERYPNNRKKEKLKWLCEKIIMHCPEKNCTKNGDVSLWDKLDYNKSLFNVGDTKGLAIGNLSSQLFANFFLTKLDKYIKYELGFEYYGRYVDDFVIISQDKEKLLESMNLITEYAKNELHVTIHPNKRYFQHYTKGVRFTGAMIKPNRIYTLNRTKHSLKYKLSKKFKNKSKNKIDNVMMTVNSYLGFMGHYNTYRIRKEILDNEELFGHWKKWLEVNEKNYNKVTRKEKPKKELIENPLYDAGSFETEENETD